MSQETVLCVDLGGTKILIGELNEKGEVLWKRKFPSDVTSQENALKKIKECLQICLTEEKILGHLIALSVAVVGRVNTVEGIWYEIHPENAQEIDLVAELQPLVNLPVVVTNDVSSAAIAEKELGIGKKTENFVYLNVGTGIAGRVVDEGKLIRGGHFNAGEIGHMVVDFSASKQCICGRYGCVESFASGLGMSNEYNRLLAKASSDVVNLENRRWPVAEIITASQKQDPLAKTVVERASRGIAELIMNMVRVSDPEAVIVGGGVMSNTFFFEMVKENLNAKTMRFVKYGLQKTEIDPNYITFVGCGINGFEKVKL
ncbi:glucokinase [Enterococcus sp. PF1-24]|uniref:ROK family protein n=1 Tax=unclassified Enterococcus TaxID=2608891 RepID=UPI002475C8A0|nr:MULTISPECIES: ROK family protein [unclassified Enterococcus]MDH6363353.1 glucokinase [Enterococcus sp. PFB1-1]MDH6400346.1 glucokinase [Enterococcus sp. PF1-24]